MKKEGHPLQVGAPDPERRTSPILDHDSETDEALAGNLEVETGVCYFNGKTFGIGHLPDVRTARERSLFFLIPHFRAPVSSGLEPASGGPSPHRCNMRCVWCTHARARILTTALDGVKLVAAHIGAGAHATRGNISGTVRHGQGVVPGAPVILEVLD